jgi:hypothetical protein
MSAIELSEAAKAKLVNPTRGRSFFARTAILMLVCVLVSFPLTYYWPVASGKGGTFAPFVHIHGAVFFSWMFLYVWQTRLIAIARSAVHREIGLAGIALSTLLVVLGVGAAIHAAKDRMQRGEPMPFAISFFNLMDMGLFTAFMTASIASVTRHREWHRRFAYSAALCLLAPAMSRWTIPYLSMPPYVPDYAFLLALAVHDWRTSGRIHPATLVSAAIIVPIRLASPWFAFSDAWSVVAPAILVLSP